MKTSTSGDVLENTRFSFSMAVSCFASVVFHFFVSLTSAPGELVGLIGVLALGSYPTLVLMAHDLVRFRTVMLVIAVFIGLTIISYCLGRYFSTDISYDLRQLIMLPVGGSIFLLYVGTARYMRATTLDAIAYFISMMFWPVAFWFYHQNMLVRDPKGYS